MDDWRRLRKLNTLLPPKPAPDISHITPKFTEKQLEKFQPEGDPYYRYDPYDDDKKEVAGYKLKLTLLSDPPITIEVKDHYCVPDVGTMCNLYTNDEANKDTEASKWIAENARHLNLSKDYWDVMRSRRKIEEYTLQANIDSLRVLKRQALIDGTLVIKDEPEPKEKEYLRAGELTRKQRRAVGELTKEEIEQALMEFGYEPQQPYSF